jgi:FlaG/FlaF family flagellin (archaellin)
MVAITVILAAVIGTFVLGLGSGQTSNPSAGLAYEQTGSGTATIRIVSVDRLDSVSASVENADSTGSPSATVNVAGSSPAAGDTITANNLADGDQIIVTGTYEGKETVLNTYTYNG